MKAFRPYRLRSTQAKYHNKKTAAGEQVFDSKKEAQRFRELSMMQNSGMIRNLETQKKYILIPTQREPSTKGRLGKEIPGAVIEREVSYIADFVYYDVESDQLVVEDVKGYRKGQAYAVFSIKRKLMLLLYGIRVREI